MVKRVMRDQEKTKDQLINELQQLGQEVERLKTIEKMLSDANRQRQQELYKRKRSDELIKQQNEQLMTIINTAQDAIFIKDSKFRYVLVNPAMERLTGHTASEMTGRTDEELFGAEVSANISRQVDRAVLSGKTMEEEHHNEIKGVATTFHTVKWPLRDSNNRLTGICGFSRDITKDKLAEEAQWRIEEQLMAIIDTTRDAIFIKDKNLKYTLVNSATARLFGHSASEFLGHTDKEIFGESFGGAAEEIDSDSASEFLGHTDKEIFGESFGGDAEDMDSDSHVLKGNIIEFEDVSTVRGVPTTFHTVKAPMRDGNGEISGLCGIARDITDQKLLEKAHRKIEAQNQAILNAIPDLMFQITKEGYIVNYKAGKYSNSDDHSGLLGKHVSDILPAEAMPSLIYSVEETLQTDEVQVFEYRDIAAEKSYCYEARVIAIDEDDFLVIIRDITERKLADEKLERRNEELDAFAHTVAHDLKGPLTGLIGFAQLLEASHSQMSDKELRECVADIEQNGRRMKDIINELLLLASVRKQEVKMTPLKMDKIIYETYQRLTYTISKCQAEIILPKSWPEALGYGPWVEEVWANYLGNALKYGGQPPRAEFGATVQSDGMIRFWLRDNGKGLTAEQQQRLFAEFTRFHEVRAQGQGLGLSIVHRIVKKLGGSVGVESKEGQGSLFFFTLKSSNTDTEKSDV